MWLFLVLPIAVLVIVDKVRRDAYRRGRIEQRKALGLKPYDDGVSGYAADADEEDYTDPAWLGDG